MHFFLDENVHAKLMPWLIQLGHNVDYIPKGTKNGQVIALGLKEKRILLTHDKDFSDAVHYPPKKHNGIIILRIHPPRLPKIQAALQKLLASPPSEGFSQRLIILEDDGFRIIS